MTGAGMLTWRTDGNFGMSSTLHDAERPCGHLKFPSWLRTDAEAEVDGQRFHLRRTGFLRTVIELRLPGAIEPRATLEDNWWGTGGRLRLGNENWTCRTGPMADRVEFLDPNGTLALRVRLRGVFRYSGEVQTGPALSDGRRELLLALGWYRLILLLWDASAVVAAG